MFRPILLTIGLCAASSAFSLAQTTSGSAPEAAPAALPPAPTVSTAEMLEVYGWILGQQMDCYLLGLSGPEVEALSRGIALAAQGRRPALELQTVGPQLQNFITSRSEAMLKKRLADNQAEEEAFLAEVDKKEGVKRTDTGLRYEVLVPGTGPHPGPTDEVVVHYHGTFVDGTVFDSSINRGEPASFPVDRVIQGWSEGVQLMNVGGKMKFYVPGQLAYGLRGNQSIPPGKLLVFEVELLSIKPAAPQLITPGLPTLAQ